MEEESSGVALNDTRKRRSGSEESRAKKAFRQNRNLESRAEKGALDKVPLLKSSPDGRGEEKMAR